MWIVTVFVLLFIFSSFVASLRISTWWFAFAWFTIHFFSITLQAARVRVYVRRHIMCLIIIWIDSKRSQSTNTRRRRRKTKRNKHIFNAKPFTFLHALCLLLIIFYVNVCMFVYWVSPIYHWIFYRFILKYMECKKSIKAIRLFSNRFKGPVQQKCKRKYCR